MHAEEKKADYETYVERPFRQVLSSGGSSHGNGAVICPAFLRGSGPLALMKSAMPGANQLSALGAHCLIRPVLHRDFVPWDHRLFRAPRLCRLPHRTVR